MSSLAGSFLVARPALKEPTFAQTVILLLQHGKEGALGLVVNRAKPSADLPLRIYVGGPCESPGLFLLHGHADWVADSPTASKCEVAPGIFLGDSSCMTRLGDLPIDKVRRVRMFTGYAGWGPNQLEGELGAGAWAVVPATDELLFDTPPEDLWPRLVPPAIPQPSVN